MGHGERPASLELLAKERHYAAAAVQHIAEPHREVGCVGVARIMARTTSSQSHLVAPMTLEGDGLVGGDEHHALHAGHPARLGDVECPEDVVLDRLPARFAP